MRPIALLVFLAQAPASRPSGDADLVFTILKTAPNAPAKPAAETAKVMAAHLANIKRLFHEGSILLAGPFGAPAPEPTARGLFVFDVATVAEAEKLAATDPAVAAGMLVAESVPLRAAASIRRIRDLEREADASRPAPAPGAPPFEIRRYVLGIAADADGADKALAPLRAQGKVALFGRLGGTKAGKALFVLDAADVAAAETLLAPLRPEMGAVALHPWVSTPRVAKLAGSGGAESRKAGG